MLEEYLGVVMTLYEFLRQELCALSKSNKQEQLLCRQDVQWTRDGKAQGITFTPKTHICYNFLCTAFRLWWHYWNNYLPATLSQEGWWEAEGTSFIFPCAHHQANSFHYWGSCCRSYLSFPRKDRGKEFNWGSCHTTTLYKKANENWFRRDSSLFPKRCKRRALLWKGALQNTTTTRSAFSKQGPVICILKGTKPSQGKQWPSGMYWLFKKTNTKRSPGIKSWNTTDFDSIPQGHHLALLPFHRCPALLILAIPGSCIYPYKGWLLPTIDGQYILFPVVTVWGHASTCILSFCGNWGKFNNILCNGRNVNYIFSLNDLMTLCVPSTDSVGSATATAEVYCWCSLAVCHLLLRINRQNVPWSQDADNITKRQTSMLNPKQWLHFIRSVSISVTLQEAPSELM